MSADVADDTINLSQRGSLRQPPPTPAPSQRAYKACNVCRKRKSRCLISEGETKCHRCKRESKPCVFPDDRYQRKSRHRRQSESLHDVADNASVRTIETFGGDAAAGSTSAASMGNDLTESVVKSVVSSGNDARDLLFTVVRDDGEAHSTTANAYDSTSPYSVERQAGLPRGAAFRPMAAVDVWNACRWTMQGWFNAEEAITLVDLYAALPTSEASS